MKVTKKCGSRNSPTPKTPVNAEAQHAGGPDAGLPYQATIGTGEFRPRLSRVVTRRLTLDYGMRYEYTASHTEVTQAVEFVSGLSLLTPQSPGWIGLYRPDRNNFGPRAFAFDAAEKGQTVIRGCTRPNCRSVPSNRSRIMGRCPRVAPPRIVHVSASSPLGYDGGDWMPPRSLGELIETERAAAQIERAVVGGNLRFEMMRHGVHALLAPLLHFKEPSLPHDPQMLRNIVWR
jgi:hypothetical protein